ncbi:bifunctional diaminohydroxyphosphoribosylaminopyrimidine deaminase/5-amino-6-(5-phosphoribosylamino)uracil reductase RibD [Defluviimonas sp. WL0002]|uniref:Riboflavin biosynthesis protein RibD n=1 Tax=Albidovulum marisflavi TaxID=2984159 RepID=A0ABT2ZDH0_9RHOB|nr:bifunctional diaminohydroxyphosphoribosylaminopyrimidine deaminase/5-amino-6-(5-phosphoribosylamino)uracil reductase RibD [Defluviimonas sp. WL0002]MCV2869159.1 bifunctional diaminohydroxyphosphoribosylaminopyrimidine deaminase/5-amino-6-(5-phosphoribosylamino)uracil reductase RibD [Defluviimonas sp. WL0002]
MSTQDDRRFMALSIALGARGLGRVWPNPAVGCVIVKDGRVVGRGWTQDGGRPHAETVALAQAGAQARGATAYVSLEPCAHHGRTPPCAVSLVNAGVARVVSAITDPDPRVAGRGHEILRGAGVSVTTGVMAEAAAAAQSGFLTRIQHGRPMVTLKLATSFDGRIATATGESKWITGPEARRMVHAMRATHDAVMVGGGTARADDPALTVRDLGIARQPVRVVCARDLDLPTWGTLARSAEHASLWLVHGPSAPHSARSAWTDIGARLIEVPDDQTALSPEAILAALGAEGLTRVFCEGGGQFAAALLRAGLVDEIRHFTAGLALGSDGRPALGALALPALAEAPRFMLRDLRSIGPDTLAHWVRA